jgi:hypothetical protein
MRNHCSRLTSGNVCLRVQLPPEKNVMAPMLTRRDTLRLTAAGIAATAFPGSSVARKPNAELYSYKTHNPFWTAQPTLDHVRRFLFEMSWGKLSSIPELPSACPMAAALQIIAVAV